jgi:hypothetical protein
MNKSMKINYKNINQRLKLKAQKKELVFPCLLTPSLIVKTDPSSLGCWLTLEAPLNCENPLSWETRDFLSDK